MNAQLGDHAGVERSSAGPRGGRGTENDPSVSEDSVAKALAEIARQVELAAPVRSENVFGRTVDQMVEALAAFSLVSLSLLLFGNAVGRYAFSASLPWAGEVATGMVVWVSMFGVFITARRRELISIRVVVSRFSVETQQRLQFTMDLLSAILLGYLAWLGLDYVMTFGGDPTVTLGLPKGVFTAALPIGAAALALVFLAAVAKSHLPLSPEEAMTETAAIEHDVAEGDGQGGTP